MSGDGQCTKCGRPSGIRKRCPECLEKNRQAVARFHGRDPNAAKVCAQEGCETVVEYRRTYCTPCSKLRKTARNRSRSRGKSPEYEEIKPHAPTPALKRKPLISEEEQARLDAEALARDRAWHTRFMKETLGLESAPGKPLASKVVRPPKEVFEQYQQQWKPQREQIRDFWLPEISY